MQMMQEVAGFSLGKADLVRKAIGKEEARPHGHIRSGIREGGSEPGIYAGRSQYHLELYFWFVDYGFNKAHAICYAYVAYQSAYLKTHYSQIFYASALTVEARGGSKSRKRNSTDADRMLALEARRRGIHVLPPGSTSATIFHTAGESAAPYGLVAIKGVGMPGCVHHHQNAPSGSLADLVVNALSEAHGV